MDSLTSSIAADRRASCVSSTKGRSPSPISAGNRQYITTGNLAENPRAVIFLMDYQHRQRVKIWGIARVIENDPELLRACSRSLQGAAEAAIVFTVEAWDANCPQHIPQMVVYQIRRSRDRSIQRAHRRARG